MVCFLLAINHILIIFELIKYFRVQKFIENYFTGLFSMIGLFALLYIIVWVVFSKYLQNRKIQLSKRAGWAQIQGEIMASVLAMLGTTVFTMYLFSLKDKGIITLYTETGKYGLGYEIFSVVLILVISDTWFYWLHRYMHKPSVYKYVHALHHKSLDVNPFTSNAFHVLEAVFLTLWILPLLLLMPVSATALGVVQALGMINNLKSHLGYELFPNLFSKAPFNVLVTATNHSLHHTQYNGNYGLFFRFWDVVCNTELKDTAIVFSEIHSRKNEVVLDNSKYKNLTINKIVKENADTVSVYFKPEDKNFYNYKAGQYLTIKVKVKGKMHSRCFSLSSSPMIDDFLRITVKLKGEVSHYFMETAKVGDEIQSLYPVGDFVLPLQIDNNETYTFVAGGSGITPLYSMIQELLKKNMDAAITLLYANKNGDNVIFKNEIKELPAKHKNFSCKNFISGQSRISTDDLFLHKDSTFFICGPESLKNAVVKNLTALKVEKRKINISNFADGYVPWFGLF
jgi:ring-1,2-phenylacetyl-CoA epoxidase subunit PaaE